MSAPGPLLVVLAPARHMMSSLKLAQPGHSAETGTQSATHSITLPTMSNAPRAETHPLRDPVANHRPVPGGVAVRRPIVRPRILRPVGADLPLRARRQPLAGVGAGLQRLEPGDVRRRNLGRETDREDVVGAGLSVVRAGSVIVARDAERRRPTRHRSARVARPDWMRRTSNRVGRRRIRYPPHARLVAIEAHRAATTASRAHRVTAEVGACALATLATEVISPTASETLIPLRIIVQPVLSG
jgi:hypothetical protein